MRDPAIENIEGQKVESHSFEHRIEWGHVALAVAAVYVASRLLSGSGEGNDEKDGERTGW